MKPLDAAFAMRIEAMRLARNQVRRSLQAQGIRISYVEVSKINRLAKVWFETHRSELIDRSLRNVLQWQLRDGRNNSSTRNSRPKAKADSHV
jgi:hypothetical protein